MSSSLPTLRFGHLPAGKLHIVLSRPRPPAPALAAAVEAMLYRALDPAGLMNPGKVLPARSA